MGNLNWLNRTHVKGVTAKALRLTHQIPAGCKTINGYAYHQSSGFHNVADMMTVSVLDNGGSKVQLVVPAATSVNEEMDEILINGHWINTQDAFMQAEIAILTDPAGELIYSHA